MRRPALSWLLLANLLNRVVTIATQLLVGSLLVPDQVGIFAVAAGMAAIASPFQSGDYGRLALQDPRDPLGIAARLTTWLLTGSLVSWLVAVTAIPALGLGVAVAPLACLAALSFPRALGNVRIALIAGAGRDAAVAAASLSEGLARSAVLVGSAWLGAGLWSLVLGEAAAALVSLAVVLHLHPGPAPGGFGLPPTIVRKLFATMGVCLLVGVELNCSAVAIGRFFSPADAGNFAFANRMAAQMGVLILPLVNLEMVPRLLAARAARERFKTESQHEVRRLLRIIAPLVALVVLVGPPAMEWVWRDKWHEAADMLRWLGLAVGLRLAYAMAKGHLEALGAFRAILALSALDTVLILSVVVAAGNLGPARLVVQGLTGEALVVLVLAVAVARRSIRALPAASAPALAG